MSLLRKFRMARQGPKARTLIHRSTLLIPSIHCPTCTNFIEGLLLALNPAPKSVQTSIIGHTVTVEHDDSVDLKLMSKVLADAGYVVDSIISDNNAHSMKADVLYGAEGPGSSTFSINKLITSLGRRTESSGERKRKREHREHCKECREHSTKDGSFVSSEKIIDDMALCPPAAIVSAPPFSNTYEATFAIDGMSCASCVGKITETLEKETWVESANINLLTRTGTVRMFDKARAHDVVSIISTLGYDASLENFVEIPDDSQTPNTNQDMWQAGLSLSGMSCSSCVGNITATVERLPWVHRIDVNLVTHSAIVTFDGSSHINDIIANIEDSGYGAHLTDIAQENQKGTKDLRRTLHIQIEGMYCEHCPPKVVEAAESQGDWLQVLEKPTLANPFLTVSYIPEPPQNTVRAIIQSIAEADPGFVPEIYHPPTVEERSQQMLKRTRQRIFLRVLLSFIVAIPTLIIGIVYMNLVSKDDPNREYLMEPLAGVSRADWSLLVMATPVYFFAADVFHRRTLKELYALWRPGSPVPLLRRLYRFGSMDMLVSFATTIAYFSSIAEMIIAATGPEPHHGQMPAHMDAVIFLTFFLLAGRMIEAYSKAKTGEAVAKLGSLRPKETLLLDPGKGKETDIQTRPVAVDMLDTGDLVRVVHGSSPPWDGILIEGQSEFIEASLTGESRPVMKRLGDPIYSGTINKGGPVTIRLTGASGESLLDSIIKVVREGQARRAPIERVADSITGYFVPVVTLVAIVTWLLWLGLGVSGRLPESWKDVAVGGWPFWSLQFAIAVFVIACPCGIGLAAPTALFVGGGLAAKHGILAKGGGEAFQEASHLDIIVFDKTGTLTEGGEPKITDYELLNRDETEAGVWTESVVLGCLGELEKNSSHPIAKAIVSFCTSRSSASYKPQGICEIPGKGVTAFFGLGKTERSASTTPPILSSNTEIEMIVGNEALMTQHDAASAFDDRTKELLDLWTDQAKSIVLVAGRPKLSDDNGAWEPLAIFAISDAVRPESRPVLDALRNQGIDVWMISGDNPRTANAVGAMVGIMPERIIAGVLPEQKADKIQFLQKTQVQITSWYGLGKSQTRRPTVAMVGDGVNDSPALTVADVGIAIGSGSDVAISAADFVLINSRLTTLLTLTRLSRAVFRRVKFNFAWALVYNMVALPIAAGVLYPIQTNGRHTRLDPVWAALAMALSSLSVITSSLLLRTRLPLIGYRDDGVKI